MQVSYHDGMVKQSFSHELEQWLKGKEPKTLNSLEKIFSERSFAIIILILMAFPALPLPTGGITHVFEIIVMLLSLEMIAGRKTIWLPKKWRQRELGQSIQGKFIPALIRYIRWFERISNPRLQKFVESRYFMRVAGLITLIFAVGAFIAPPFVGLDTLPALGAVVVALSIILGDIVVFIIGCLLGAIGLGLVLALGSVSVNIVRHFL